MTALAPVCRLCRQPFAANPIGRPKVFCSRECRRAMAQVRDELVALTAQLAEARAKETSGFWPGSRFWSVEAHRLELAIAQAKLLTSYSDLEEPE